MIFFRKPSPEKINLYLVQQKPLDFTYPEVGATNHLKHKNQYKLESNIYNFDTHNIQLGEGKLVYAKACAALSQWQMFANGWTQLCWNNTPIKAGETVATLVKVFGLWWLNVCRIVYVISETEDIRQYGFAYGTLPMHAECGEELFLIQLNSTDNTVWYSISAFSRPRHWLVKLAYPLTRRLQKKFALDSLKAMNQAINE